MNWDDFINEESKKDYFIELSKKVNNLYETKRGLFRYGVCGGIKCQF